MISLSLSDILPFLLMGARWTLLLSAIAFLGGGIGGVLFLFLRYGRHRFGAGGAHRRGPPRPGSTAAPRTR